jgi:hypothetical protein
MTKKELLLATLPVLRALLAQHSPECFDFTNHRRKDRVKKKGVIFKTNMLYYLKRT